MGIIVVEHSDTNVTIVKQYLYGSTIKKSDYLNIETRKIMDCYAEGMGLNSICRVFKVSINTVQAWIKAEGKEFKQPNISEEKFVSCDEMWTFVQKKPTKHGYGSVSQK